MNRYVVFGLMFGVFCIVYFEQGYRHARVHLQRDPFFSARQWIDHWRLNLYSPPIILTIVLFGFLFGLEMLPTFIILNLLYGLGGMAKIWRSPAP